MKRYKQPDWVGDMDREPNAMRALAMVLSYVLGIPETDVTMRLVEHRMTSFAHFAWAIEFAMCGLNRE